MGWVGGLALLVSPADLVLARSTWTGTKLSMLEGWEIMGIVGLPSWLPDWAGAEAESRKSDVSALRLRAQELVDLVLTEDTEYLDALPASIESAIVTPLSVLSDSLDEGTDVEVIVASRLVRRAIDPFLKEAPEELRRLIGYLPFPVGQ